MASSEAQRLEAVRYRIETLLQLVRDGKVRLPDFQRKLRWADRDVHRLFDSIYRGYPIGTLLFWERSAPAATVRLGPITIEAPELKEASWVIDGQQRVTSLAASLLSEGNSEDDQRFQVAFDLVNEQFGRMKENDPDTKIPVRGAFELQKVMSWVRERQLDEVHQERAFKLADRLRNYEIPAYRVEADDEQALREIFDRINTFGKRMTKAEVFRALNTSSDPKSDLGSLGDEIAAQGFGSLAGNTLVYCVLATQGPDVLREFRSEFGEDSTEAFGQTFAAVQRTISFLRDVADVPHFDLVPYQFQTVGLVRFFALHPEPSAHDLTLLRRWFWRSAEVGPLPKPGNTGTLRAVCSAVSNDSSFASVSRLLAVFDDQPPPDFELGQFRWTAASTRVAVCALARRHPISPDEGQRIDVTEAIELAGSGALRKMAPTAVTSAQLTVANRLLIHPSESGTDEEIFDAVTRNEAAMASHVLSPRAAKAYLSGDMEAFLTQREQLLLDLTTEFLAARTERDKATLPSIEQLVLDG